MIIKNVVITKNVPAWLTWAPRMKWTRMVLFVMMESYTSLGTWRAWGAGTVCDTWEDQALYTRSIDMKSTANSQNFLLTFPNELVWITWFKLDNLIRCIAESVVALTWLVWDSSWRFMRSTRAPTTSRQTTCFLNVDLVLEKAWEPITSLCEP